LRGAAGLRHRASTPAPAADSAEAVLQHGHAWLNFPAALEQRFQAETLAPRRKLLLFCALIGTIAICVGSLNLPQLMPDIAEQAVLFLYGILATAVPMQLLLWRMPVVWRRPWQGEAVTALPILTVNACVIADCALSQVTTTFSHSAALVSTLMFGCIAARLRFWWSVGCALSSFVAYATFVHGTTPEQQLIVNATAGLMALSYAFALVANYAFEHGERRNWLLHTVEAEQRQALQQASERLHRLSTQDPLTRLYNRRQFDAELSQAWSQALLGRSALCLLMVDVDHFKRYNDRYGHPTGDTCLIHVAQALAQVAQAHGGIAARMGGEEFGLLLPGRTLAQAVAAGEALCEAIRQARIEHLDAPLGWVSVSVGAAQVLPTPGAGVQTLVDLADQALYQAKHTGRDRVCGAHLPSQASTPAADGPAPDAEPAVTPPTTGGTSADVVALGTAPETPYIDILAGGFRRLRFPAEHEAAYLAHNADHRRLHLLRMTVLGLLIYMAYMVLNRAMYSDVAEQVLRWQAALVGIALLAGVANHLTRPPVLLAEGLFSLGNAVIAMVTAWLLSTSALFTALAFSVCLVLIPMFSGVAGRQPFWFTCVSALLTVVAAVTFLHPSDPAQQLVFTDSVTMIVTNTAFTLILSWTLDHDSRKQWLLSQIGRLQGEALASANRRLQELSMLDPLTGICNRRQFEEDLQALWDDGLQRHRTLAMLVVDVDHFKRYNDGYGHPAGDRCLQQVAAFIDQQAEAAHGLSARLGGEEFGILLEGVSPAKAEALARQLCQGVRQLGIEHTHTLVDGQAVVTVSVGVSSIEADPRHHRRMLFALADEALYQAKRDGRNQVGSKRAPALQAAVLADVA
jgi:diguanylate cyclase (GGDEF)-like protein